MFKPTFASLYGFEAPVWYRDAKFGIWAHWGPQSVPMAGDWYARHMYEQGSAQYEHHLRTYGHPSKFGYKDICALWKAESFDPEALMDLYVQAGAKFFCAQAMHHDNFFNYNSKLNPMNSALVGPHKDICALWQSAAKKHGLPFGLSEHLARSFSWWYGNKGADTFGAWAGVPYDGNDPAYRAFYHDNYCYPASEKADNVPSLTSDTRFHAYWRSVMHELIDRFEPDFLYSDSSLPFGRHWADKTKQARHDEDRAYDVGLETVAELYNKSIEKHGENRALYLQKNSGKEIYKIGVLDLERSVMNEAFPDPWNTDTCIGGWFYDTRAKYKSPMHIIEMLVDIVSKNGCMMLNIPQRPDGTIDEESKYILRCIGEWMRFGGEGLFFSRPWRVCGEGDAAAMKGEERVRYGTRDVRYTQKDGKLYAYLMHPEAGATAVLHALHDVRVKSVASCAGELPFEQFGGKTLIRLPEKLTSYQSETYPCYMLRIEGEGI